MKNIHILPTDKPSNITNRTKTNELMYSYKLFSSKNGKDINVNQHIYITSSDEEIKDVRPHKGRWHLEKENILNKFPNYLTDLSECKLVIMTTDQDLINDGVQAIDDEFLEWFVKNHNCDFVDISTYHIRGDISGKLHYKIIIPKEEAKKKDWKDSTKALMEAYGDDPKDFPYEPKQEDCDRTYQPISLGEVDEEEYKQETIEEAAYNYASKKLKRPITVYAPLEANVAEYVGFFDGAEWKEQNSDKKWSDNDIINALHSVELKHNKNYTVVYDEMKKWLNESKKK